MSDKGKGVRTMSIFTELEDTVKRMIDDKFTLYLS